MNQSFDLKKYSFQGREIQWELLRDLKHGNDVIELDEQLFHHLREYFAPFLYFDSPNHFVVELISEFGAIQFLSDEEKYFARPPGLIAQ